MTRKLLFDLIERAWWTFIQSSSGVLVGAAVFDIGVPALQVAGMAGIASVLSLLKGFAASRLTSLDTASTVPLVTTDAKDSPEI